MRRFINGFIALIFAAALIVGTFYLLDITRDEPEEPKSTGMAIETPVYDRTVKLMTDIDDLTQSSEHFCTCVDDYVKECVTHNGGGTYTDTHGHKVTISPSGGSSTTTTTYYHDDDHTTEHHDEGGSSGTGWVPSGNDVGHDYIGGGGDDIDLGNYCSVCGTYYYGTGLCPNGCQN